MAIVISWLILAGVVAYIASNRGRSGIGFFFLSLLLSPIIGLVIVLCTNPGSAAQIAKANTARSALSKTQDDAQWADIVRYDPDISAAVARLSPYGNAAVNRFRDAYTSVDNKAAIPAIVADIEAAAQSKSLPAAVPEGKIFSQGDVRDVGWKYFDNGVYVGQRGNDRKAFHTFDELEAYFGI